ncbi:MAG: hypothetical protein NC489_33675 [Ruminococcus flavefaciens]|nr:hypothetical protein [Ruminococcus flavefaciens]
MIEKGFVAHAGGRYFRARENSVTWATVIDSPTFDLLFRECVIIGAEIVDAPMIEGMMYVLRQNFGRYLLVIIERDSDNEENDLALAVRVAEAEEITAEEVNIQDKQSERNEH